MLTWTITRNDVTSVNVEMCGTRGACARIFPRAPSECAGSTPGRAPARYHSETIEHRGSGAERDSERPGVKPSLVPIQAREIPFSGPASLPDVVLGQTCQKLTIASMPADNGCTGRLRSCRTNVQAFWASRGSESGLCSVSRRMRSETCAISPPHSTTRARAPDNEPGKDTGSPRRAPVRIARRQLQLPRARAFGRNCNSLGQGCPRLSCPAGTTYEFLMPPPSSWGVHCAC
jgi:hypothetical protein